MTSPSADPLSIVRAQLADADEGTEDILIGIIDGVPDVDLPVFDDVALTIEPSMLPADPGAPDSPRHGDHEPHLGARRRIGGFGSGMRRFGAANLLRDR